MLRRPLSPQIMTSTTMWSGSILRLRHTLRERLWLGFGAPYEQHDAFRELARASSLLSSTLYRETEQQLWAL